jgi:hypothetical protein
LPLGAVASAANVHDSKMFPELLRLALVVGVRIARLFADAGYHSADNRWLCRLSALCARASNLGSARPARSTVPDSASFAPSSRMPMPGCSTTNASIEDTTAQPESFNRCSPPPVSLSSQTGSPIYENRL